MSAKLKWELHIVGEDLVSETATLLEVLNALHARNLPAPTEFTTTHMDVPPPPPLAGLSWPEPDPTPPAPPAPPAPAPAKRGRPPKVAKAPEPEPEAEAEAPQPEDIEAAEAPLDIGAGHANGSTEFDNLTGAEAREKALVLLRMSYAAPDGAPAVKALQKSLGVAKFSDVPDEQGHGLLAKAVKMAEGFGLVTPT